MAVAEPFVTLVPSAARTTNGQDVGYWEWGRRRRVIVSVNATAVSGTTPVLTVFVEGSNDNGSTWQTHATFPTINSISVNDLAIGGQFPNVVRIRWTITGTTPSFTFTVTAGYK